MRSIAIVMISILATAGWTAASAQGNNQTQQGYGSQNRRPASSYDGARQAVPTQPSANPFKDPLGNVPPTASANPAQNNSQTRVPLAR